MSPRKMREQQEPDPIRVSAVIGTNLRVLRNQQAITQSDLAGWMNELGFTTWRQSTVGDIEAYERQVTADELVGLSIALGEPIQTLIDPLATKSRSVESLSFGGRFKIPTGKVQLWLNGIERLRLEHEETPTTDDEEVIETAATETRGTAKKAPVEKRPVIVVRIEADAADRALEPHSSESPLHAFALGHLEFDWTIYRQRVETEEAIAKQREEAAPTRDQSKSLDITVVDRIQMLEEGSGP